MQKLIVSLMGLPVIAAFIVPPLDFRFGWSNVPLWLVIAGDILFMVSIWMVYRVYKVIPSHALNSESRSVLVISPGTRFNSLSRVFTAA